MDGVGGKTERELVGDEVSEGVARDCLGAGAGVDVCGGVNLVSDLVSESESVDVAGSEACGVSRALLKNRGPV